MTKHWTTYKLKEEVTSWANDERNFKEDDDAV